ncbi:MAG: hypothetical protein M1821_007079 [Bathelium mastoideum]|nr:MAG: hypothetical protein M1821_007079 [Bathelium mastoideum]
MDYLRNPVVRCGKMFPGPAFAAISNTLYSYWFLGGRQPYHILDLHEKFGPVVRTAPNDLSFNTAQSWKDIYGSRSGAKPFVKSSFYDGGSFADQAHSIVSVRDVSEHSQMKKYLSNAFSQRSLMEQEPLIAEVIDKFIKAIGIRGAVGINIVQWYNMMTLDIIGALAFGEDFKGVESGKPLPWIELVIGALKQGALADTFKRFPTIASAFLSLMPGALQKIIEQTKVFERKCIELMEKRVAKKDAHPDFMTRILEERDPSEVSDIQLAAHAADFVTAGTETTATALSCITYYLLKSPEALERLRKEIHASFKSYGDINATSTASLKYLNAVINEGLRIFPPLPFALPRVVPPGGEMVDGHFIPAGIAVSTNPIAACQSSKNFSDPLSFLPERWLEHDSGDLLEASQPFSLGSRGCLGISLGWMELRTTLAKLHYRYELELTNPLDWQKEARMHTLWVKPQLLVKVKPRTSIE